MWINPKITGTAEERKVVVTMGEPGGLFVLDRETGEFLWATPLPYTSTERFVIFRYRPGDRSGLHQHGPRGERAGPAVHHLRAQRQGVVVVVLQPAHEAALHSDQPGLSESDRQRQVAQRDESSVHRSRAGTGGGWRSHEVRAVDISTGREVWRYSQRAPNAGTTLATGGNVVFFGDLERRFRAFDAETGEVLWETIMGSQITGFPVTYMAGGKQYLTVPVGGASIMQLSNWAPELEAPLGSNMLVTFAIDP